MPRAFLVTRALATISFVAACVGQGSQGARVAAPTPPARALDRLSDYTPLHKGGVDLASGLYVRQNEDLVVPGTPALILRRTYLAGYRISKQFGIGALHNGEEYLIGDGQDFQWAALILARGSRIHFRRVSAGTSVLNAQYVHDETAREWYGARLNWTGLLWALRKSDGSTMMFRACGPGSTCSILQSRDPEGHTIYYQRSFSGALLKMTDGTGRWIGFDYDDSGRISRASASTGRAVRYQYDSRGRLAAATASDGLEYRYTYTDLDELATIEEPGTSIENRYADGRCVHQVNRYPDREPYVFDFTYHREGTRIVRTDTRTSDGTYKSYTWDEARRTMTESLGREGYDPIVFTYGRDATTKAVTSLSVTCPDFGAGTRRRTAAVASGAEDEVKAELMAHCFTDLQKR